MLRILDDRIAVIPIEDPSRIGSIWVPNSARRRSDQGVIKYRGANVKELKVGDHVLYGCYVGTRISIQNEGHLIVMQEVDAIAVLEKGTETLFTRDQVVEFFGRALGYVLTRDVDDPLLELSEAFEAEFDAYDNSLVEF